MRDRLSGFVPDTRTSIFGDRFAETRAGISTQQLLGQVMFLVAPFMRDEERLHLNKLSQAYLR